VVFDRLRHTHTPVICVQSGVCECVAKERKGQAENCVKREKGSEERAERELRQLRKTIDNIDLRKDTRLR